MLKTIPLSPKSIVLIEAIIVKIDPKTAPVEMNFNFVFGLDKNNCVIAQKIKIAIPVKYKIIFPLKLLTAKYKLILQLEKIYSRGLKK